MRASYIETLPAPVPCAACGRPTMRFNRVTGVADCGRDPETAVASDGFGPPLRGTMQRRRWAGKAPRAGVTPRERRRRSRGGAGSTS